MSFHENRSGKTCKACGAKLFKKRVRCQYCLAWNLPKTVSSGGGADDGTMLLSDVKANPIPKLKTGPWDINFASPRGVPVDAVALIGGIPGAGKSTLALQLCGGLSSMSQHSSLYVAAEETKDQVQTRAERLCLRTDKIRIVPLERLTDFSLDFALDNRRYSGVVVDSISRFTNDPEEAVEIVSSLKLYAAKIATPFLVINHVTKDGDMAGLMKLQHAGDISLMLTKSSKDEVVKARFRGGKWDEFEEIRELYTEKSRYGPSGVTTCYAMTERGLQEIEIGEDDDV